MSKTVLPPVVSLLSGGKDSFACAKRLEQENRLLACAAIHTGIATPDWQDSVTALCKSQNWPLHIIKTTDSYDRIVLKYGFPGPAQHGMFMNYLKGRAIRVFKKLFPGTMLASGVRAAESNRRALSTKPLSTFEGVQIIAPIYDWTTEQTWEFARSFEYKRPRAYSTLQISGDCLCGAFARPDEREAIAYWYPEINARFNALESQLDQTKESSKWGWGCNRKPRARKSKGEQAACYECARFDES